VGADQDRDGTDADPVIDASHESNGDWRLDLVSTPQRKVYKDHRYVPEAHNVTFEPLADGEEVLFFQAMLAPHTLETGVVAVVNEELR
jgi:hypothetical protein